MQIQDRGRSLIHRRVAVLAGVTMIVAATSILGWAAWQFWGTNWASERHQEDVKAALEKAWRAEVPAAETETEFGRANAILRVPRFGDDYAVPILEGSSDEVLAAGVGHMSGTASAGRLGNYALAAHRVTHGEPFAQLPELRPGDLVEVETARATYTYVLDTGGGDLTVPFTETWVLGSLPRNPDRGETTAPIAEYNRLITLLSCSEIFHTDNRSVVFGHLLRAAHK